MIIKNFLVNDMYEAMVVIKQELGSDAVIVSKRFIRQKGIFGLFKKRMLEVTAATDAVAKPNSGIVKKSDISADINNNEVKESVKDDGATETLKLEMKELKNMVNKLMENTNLSTEKEKMSTLKDFMVDMDLHSKVISDFEEYCNQKELDLENINKTTLYEFSKDRLNSKVFIKEADGRIRTFIGPTGVGKTTTIAKLASNECLMNQKSIGLITIDTYRIGAVEQLKIYANILDIPIKVIFSPEDLPSAIEEFEDKDLIFIDSTGRSHKNIHQLNELKSYLDKCDNMKTYLVLSMSTKNIDFIKTIENYKRIGFDNLILTKFDETYTYGNILNIGYFTEKPITYISTGQIVPDDIEDATKEKLFKYIWGEV